MPGLGAVLSWRVWWWVQVEIVHYLTDNDSIGDAICKRAGALRARCSPAPQAPGMRGAGHLVGALPGDPGMASDLGLAPPCFHSLVVLLPCRPPTPRAQACCPRCAAALNAAAVVLAKHQRGAVSEFFLGGC